jgi:tetratricopeptide (TPR) repeat protein/nucleoside phosphorylase
MARIGSKKGAALSDPSIDFVIITALEEERDAILSKLGRTQKLDKESSDVHTYYQASVRTERKDRSKYNVIVTSLSHMGPTEAATRAALVVKRWSPRYVLLVGIACGVRGEVQHGDVLIATQVADYTLGKQHNDRREVRWNVTPCGASLLDSAINISSKWHQRIGIPRPSDGQSQLRKGVVASGGDVIADDRIIAAYSENWPKLVGIEMEAGGVAAALQQTSERPEFLMVKGVSDFGKDKHDPEVLPWRKYACHAAAAFARAVIESGPSSKAESYLEEKTRDENEQRRAAERRWSYLQDSPLRGLEVLFVLKSPVGRDWLRGILNETRIRFSRDGKSFALGTVLSLSPAPNTAEHGHDWKDAVCSFWDKYEPDASYWVKRIAPNPSDASPVAGFDAAIPWPKLEVPGVSTLGELGRVSEFGFGIPPEAFMAGVEEFEVTFIGDQFGFSISLSDHGLEMLHEMASAHFKVSGRGKPAPLSLGSGFSGFQLLEMFLEDLLPHPRKKKKERGAISGMGGPGGKAISFYPSMPLNFTKTAESDEYSFSITVPNEEEEKKRIAELESKVAKGSADAEMYGELAARYSNQGRLLVAIQCLENAIGKVPPDINLYGLLGECLGQLGRFAEAAEYLKKGAELAPENAGIHAALGMCMSHMSLPSEALAHFEAAVQLEPSKARHHANLGRALATQARYADAIVSYERAVELAPDDANSLLFLGVLYDDKGDSESAERQFEAATRAAPNDPETHENFGRHIAHKGDHAKAISILERAIEIEESARRYELLGGSFAALSRWPESETAFRKAVALAPENPQFLANLGICVANQGRYEEAITTFEKVLVIESDNATASKILHELRAMSSPRDAEQPIVKDAPKAT